MNAWLKKDARAALETRAESLGLELEQTKGGLTIIKRGGRILSFLRTYDRIDAFLSGFQAGIQEKPGPEVSDDVS